MVTPDTDVDQQMLDMIIGHWVSQTIRAVAELSLADHFSDGPLTAAEIAAREGGAVDTTLRLLRAAFGLGLVTAEPMGRFHGTTLLATLRKDAPRSLRPFAMSLTSRPFYMQWLELVPAIRHGETQIHNVLGTDLFTYLAQHPRIGTDFSAAMASLTSVLMHDVAKAIDTSGVRRAVDVGGANGELLRMLQEANPELHGVVFDLPHIVEQAQVEIARSGFPDRTEIVGGDFFEGMPSGDLYLLKWILHDWNDEQCVGILQQCRAAMAPGDRIAIIEIVLNNDGDPGRFAALTDLNMLTCNPGRERTLEEYDALLTEAGLVRTVAVQPAGSPHTIIEAVVTLDQQF